MSTSPRWWPSLTGKIHPEAEFALKVLQTSFQEHDAAIIALKGQLSAAVVAQTTVNETIQTAAATSPATSSFGQVNNQTGTAYTSMASDLGKIVTLNNAAPVALTLSNSVGTPFYCFVENLGAGLATLTPSGGTLNGVASIPLSASQSCFVVFDGVNWWAATTPQSAQTLALVTHKFFTSYSALTGVFTAAQPAIADVSGLGTALGLLAPIAGPTFTGIVTQPDATVLTAATTTASATAGGASALPATPAGYLVMSLNGTQFKVPYYAV